MLRRSKLIPQNQTNLKEHLIVNLVSLSTWLIVAASSAGLVYCTIISIAFELDQRQIFSVSEYPQFGIQIGKNIEILISISLLLLVGVKYFPGRDEIFSIKNFLKIISARLILIAAVFMFSCMYAWPRLGVNPLIFFRESYVSFALVAFLSVLFDTLRFLRLRNTAAVFGFVIFTALLISSALDAVSVVSKCISKLPAKTEPRYVGAQIEPGWCHVVSTQKFEVFFDSKENTSFALRADVLERIEYPRSINPEYSKMHGTSSAAPLF